MNVLGMFTRHCFQLKTENFLCFGSLCVFFLNKIKMKISDVVKHLNGFE